jgi:hypothetical protein
MTATSTRLTIDPIFAAIRGHRIAEAALARAKSDSELDRRGDIGWGRYAKLLATKPTSIMGCAALLRYIGKHEYGVMRSAGKRLFSRIAAALEGIRLR